MSRRSPPASRRDAVGFRQKSATFIDDWRPIGVGALALLAGTYEVYDHVHMRKERKLKGKIAQNDWRISQNARHASDADLQLKDEMNRITVENARIEQRKRLEEVGHPEWAPRYMDTAEYLSYPMDRYQAPPKWQPSEDEVDERFWYEKKRWVALGGLAVASTAIMATELNHAEESPSWKEKDLAIATFGVGLACTVAAAAVVGKHNGERDFKSRSEGKRKDHRSHHHSLRHEDKYSKSSYRHKRDDEW